MLYIFSLCGTQDCTLFMQKRIESLSGDLVSHFLLASSCNGNPTLKMVNTFKVRQDGRLARIINLIIELNDVKGVKRLD